MSFRRPALAIRFSSLRSRRVFKLFLVTWENVGIISQLRIDGCEQMLLGITFRQCYHQTQPLCAQLVVLLLLLPLAVLTLRYALPRASLALRMHRPCSSLSRFCSAFNSASSVSRSPLRLFCSAFSFVSHVPYLALRSACSSLTILGTSITVAVLSVVAIFT